MVVFKLADIQTSNRANKPTATPHDHAPTPMPHALALAIPSYWANETGKRVQNYHIRYRLISELDKIVQGP